MWMSHGDCVTVAPAGFTVTASSAGAPVAAFEHVAQGFAGVQFHPEVAHTPYGQRMLERFLYDIAKIEPTWTMGNIIDDQVAAIRAQVGSASVICGLSGGVDSAVAAALVHKAVGDQLTCVFVDHGLLRAGEAEQVERDYVAATGIKLKVVDCADRFLGALAGVTDPEEKRKIIGREFIRVFEQARVPADVGFLVQGTLYPDVVESGGGTGTANIKSHHNVGGLPADMQVRAGRAAAHSFQRRSSLSGYRARPARGDGVAAPVPGPGLGHPHHRRGQPRTTSTILRAADLIARQELTASGLDGEVWQFPVVLLADVRSVGVQGDGRTYGHPVVLRPVSSEDAMTADWSRLPYDLIARISTRITNEVRDVNRVVLDVTSKPPGTIEWE